VIATGVDWISAAPVLVAVTVTISDCDEMASSKSNVASPASRAIAAVRDSKPLSAASI
jgi:hypothetical protein